MLIENLQNLIAYVNKQRELARQQQLKKTLKNKKFAREWYKQGKDKSHTWTDIDVMTKVKETNL